MTTIAVVPAEDKDCFKVLVNYIQRGIVFHSRSLANNEATKISEMQHCDNLVLCQSQCQERV